MVGTSVAITKRWFWHKLLGLRVVITTKTTITYDIIISRVYTHRDGGDRMLLLRKHSITTATVCFEELTSTKDCVGAYGCHKISFFAKVMGISAMDCQKTTYRCSIAVIIVCLSSASASNTSCPIWFYYNNSTRQCECGHGLGCINDHKVTIEEGTCATSYGQGDQYYIGVCPLGHPVNRTNRMHSEMPSDPDMLDDVMCGPYNRKGLLCGECNHGYGPAVNSFDLKCIACSKWSAGYATILYLLIELFPITIFFIWLVAFRFNTTSGPFLGYLIFCQYYVIWLRENMYIHDHMQIEVPTIKVIFQTSLSLTRIWNLQYFQSVIPPFCISENLTAIRRILLLCQPLALLFL